jgi:integrase/recombinase XerC/integrase/recombinase XerD
MSPDVDLAERAAVIAGKAGGTERIYWATTTARLLTRYLHGRRAGPVFSTQRRPRRPVATADSDPETGWVRLSYRRAADVFVATSGEFILHQLRHLALTHLAENGVHAMLLPKSRHCGLRSLDPTSSPATPPWTA